MTKRELSKRIIFFLGFCVGFATRCLAQPAVASAFCLDQYKAVEANGLVYSPYVRWAWLSHWAVEKDGTSTKPTERAERERIATLIAINSSINRSATIYRADLVVANGTALLPIDFNQLADDTRERDRLLREYDSMGFDDPYLHSKIIVREKIVESKGKASLRATRVTVPALHAPATFELNSRVGCIFSNDHWDRIALPLARADWLIPMLTGSLENQKYLSFIGVVPGKTTFGGYLADKGVDLKGAIKRFKVERAGALSRITGKQRAVCYMTVEGKATYGSTVFVFTLDIKDNNNDPNADPLVSYLNPDVQAIEAFFPAPDGGIECTLWQVGAGKQIFEALSVAEAPPNIASDDSIPTHFTKRLNGFISCARCHASNEFYQPFENEVRDVLLGYGRVLTDLSKGVGIGRQFEAYREILSSYNATQDSIDGMLATARDAWDKFAFRITDCTDTHAGATASNALAKEYNKYEYEWIDAREALADAGITIPANDPFGAKTFRQYVPPLQEGALIPEGAAGLFARLGTTYWKTEGVDAKGKPIRTEYPLELTRRQYEQIFSDFMQRVALVEKK